MHADPGKGSAGRARQAGEAPSAQPPAAPGRPDDASERLCGWRPSPGACRGHPLVSLPMVAAPEMLHLSEARFLCIYSVMRVLELISCLSVTPGLPFPAAAELPAPAQLPSGASPSTDVPAGSPGRPAVPSSRRPRSALLPQSPGTPTGVPPADDPLLIRRPHLDFTSRARVQLLPTLSALCKTQQKTP
jgi:hypothetical protein